MDLIVFIIIISSIVGSYIYINFIYRKYSKANINKKMNGFEVAREIIDSYELNNIYITESRQILYSKYDSGRKVIKLTPDVFDEMSLTSTAIAATVAVHAVLEKKKDKLFLFKKNLEQFINVLLYIGYMIVIIGLMFGHPRTIIIGAGVLLAILLFHICTIQTEIKTRDMAYTELLNHKIITKKEENRIYKLLKVTGYINIASIVFPFAELLKKIFEFGNSNK